jgi:hypothetical protein
MTTRRDNILKVALEYGWEEISPHFNASRDRLMLSRQVPGGHSFSVVEVLFKDHDHTTVAECRTGVDALNQRLTGGHVAIKRHLRWNGKKA